MSNKAHSKLNKLDQILRKLFPESMTNGTIVQVKIEKICGFELFNTRPYHNYETWSDGYRITAGNTVVQAEDLDDAIYLLEAKLNESKN
jgi:hypothetical protein